MEKFIEINKNILSKMYQHLKCSICLNWLKDPMMTQCGHRYCNECINNAIKSMPPNKENNYFCKCPLCGQKITKRSLVQQNHLCEIIDKAKLVIDLFNKKHSTNIYDEMPVFEVSTTNIQHQLNELNQNDSSNEIIITHKKPSKNHLLFNDDN